MMGLFFELFDAKLTLNTGKLKKSKEVRGWNKL